MHGAGWMLFVMSGAGLLAASVLVARRLAEQRTDQAWIALAVGTMLLGAVSLVASAMGHYTPAGFLSTQAALSLAAVALSSAAGRRAGWRLDRAVDSAAQHGASKPLRTGEWAMLIVIALALALSGAERWIAPVHGYDDLVYHASRAGYWVQNGSVFPFDTHDDRQNAFPFGVELLFAWPLLLTRSDLPGRMLVWSVALLAPAGLFSVARAAGAPRHAALLAALLYAVTPGVLRLAPTLKPDLWTPLFVLGAAYWVARAPQRPHHVSCGLFWAGVMVALAMNTKIIVAAMIPPLAIAPLVILPLRHACRELMFVAAGGLVATAISGLGLLLIANSFNYGHPLGPGHLRETVQAELSPRQLYTHAVRFPIMLVEFPETPSSAARAWMEKAVKQVIATLDADEPLPREENGRWPGPYAPRVNAYAMHFGLGGILWLPLLALGLVMLGSDVIRTSPRVRLQPVSLIVLLQAPLLVGPLFLVRWMWGGDRFWLPAYALILAAGVAMLARWQRARRPLAIFGVLAAGAAAYPALRQAIVRIEASARREYRPSEANWFGPALEHVPHGSTILFFGAGGAHDYQLLAPDGRLVNRVLLWGAGPFDPVRLESLIEQGGVGYVMTWRLPPREEPKLESWVSDRADVRELAVETAAPIRLFAVDPADAG